MLRIISLLLLSVNIVACDATMENGSRIGNNIKNSFDKTRYKISRYIHKETPPPQQQPYVEPPPATFCYDVVSDIMCFDRPKPEMHLNLVAVHGENNYQYNDYLPNNVMNNDANISAYVASSTASVYNNNITSASGSSEIKMRNLPSQ